jgi:hypothetical protein
MKQVYMLQVQGWGDDEYEFVNIGAYSSKVNAEMAQRNAISEWAEDTGGELVTKIEVWELDA